MSETAIGVLSVLIFTPLCLIVIPWVLIYVVLGRRDTFDEF